MRVTCRTVCQANSVRMHGIPCVPLPSTHAVMPIRRLLALGSLLLSSSAAVGAQLHSSPIRLIVQTTMGDITLAIDSAHAPRTAANFLAYVDGGHFRDAQFHRTVTLRNQETSPVKIEVIQGSVSPAREKDDFPPIAIERTDVTGLRHRNGTLSMARGGPNSATSSFFICIGDQPELDFGGRRNADGQGFAAFGVVTAGMDLVRAIQASPANGQTLTPPVRIVNIVRVQHDGAARRAK